MKIYNLLFILFLFFFVGCSSSELTFNESISTKICDPLNNSDCAGVMDGNLKVILQDQTTDPLGFYMMEFLNNVTIAIDTILDSNIITFEPSHNFIAGDWVCLQENNHVYQAEVIGVNINVITFDTPLDYAYTTSAYGCRANINMAVDGSVSPVIFRVRPIKDFWTVDWDITRIICSISDNLAMDSGKFGGINALDNGVVLRKKNGVFKNLFNVKTNSDYADVAYDVSYDDRAPAGNYGFRVRKTWAGQEKSGVAIRLIADDSEELQNLIQDDLTALGTYKCRVDGSLTN